MRVVEKGRCDNGGVVKDTIGAGLGQTLYNNNFPPLRGRDGADENGIHRDNRIFAAAAAAAADIESPSAFVLRTPRFLEYHNNNRHHKTPPSSSSCYCICKRGSKSCHCHSSHHRRFLASSRLSGSMPRSPRNVSTITPGRVTASAWTDTTTTKFPSPDFSLGAAAAHTLRFQDSPMIKSEDGIIDEEIKEEMMSDAEEMDSPLLKASQERGFINPGPLPPLNDKCSASSSRFASSSVRERGSTLYAFRQRPYRIQSEGKSDVVDSESNVNSSSPPIFDNDRHTFRLNPHHEGENEMRGMHNVSTKDTIVDAASILLSIGQCGKSRSSSVASGGTGGSCNRKAAFLEEAYEEKGDGNTFAASSNVATCYGRVNSAMKNDSSSALLLHTSQDMDATKRVRVFPPSVPILLEQFPRLYQRYRVPAVRGKRSLGVWNEPQDDLDLYTPRWVRGEGRDKEGLCIICLQHQPRVMRWKRIKTSEYNYHLINQHGISPNTQRPYDPPIAIRTRDISNPAAGHRQSVIQGKCHVCKKFVDMQGKYSRDVKVPEIYWWKHARQCHKGKAGLVGTGGTFVEDEVSIGEELAGQVSTHFLDLTQLPAGQRYQQICADIEAKPVSSAVQQ